jgi:predicted RNase H-like HicB family nuclease
MARKEPKETKKVAAAITGLSGIVAVEVDSNPPSYYTLTVKADKAGKDDVFVARVAELPGCLAQGNTPAEAIDSLQEAISLHLSKND